MVQGLPIEPIVQRLKMWGKENIMPLSKGYKNASLAIEFEVRKAARDKQITNDCIEIVCHKGIKQTDIVKNLTPSINSASVICALADMERLKTRKSLFILNESHEKIINWCDSKAIDAILFRA